MKAQYWSFLGFDWQKTEIRFKRKILIQWAAESFGSTFDWQKTEIRFKGKILTQWAAENFGSTISLIVLAIIFFALFPHALFPGTVSILTMVVIGYDRYNVIVKGFNGVKITPCKAFALLLLIWSYSAGVCCPPFLGWGGYALGQYNLSLILD